MHASWCNLSTPTIAVTGQKKVTCVRRWWPGGLCDEVMVATTYLSRILRPVFLEKRGREVSCSSA